MCEGDAGFGMPEETKNMDRFDARTIMKRIISAIEKNKSWLSEIDGEIGDGDHGVNMAKGFKMVNEKLDTD